MTGEWPAIRKKKCMEKYDHGPFIQEANCYLRDCLWEEVKLEDNSDWCNFKLQITVTEVLHTRAFLSRNKSPSGDHIVPEMILALPLIICYDVATLFDDKFQHGGGSKIQSWHELLLCFIKKVARPKEFVDLRGISLISCFAKWFMLCALLLASRVPRPRRWRPVCSSGFMKEKSVSDICGALTLLFCEGC